MKLVFKNQLIISLSILGAVVACGLMNRPAMAAYRPEYYYYNMDSLHSTINKSGMTDSKGVSRANLFPVLIDPDPNYVSSKVTLTAEEKQWVLTTINHETGSCKVGAIMEAQVIRDAYLYMCGLYGSSNKGCPYSTIRGIITHMYSTSYLKTTPANQLISYTTEAYSYVFEQGNSFYPMKLLTFRGWRLNNSDVQNGYKEAIVMNSHYDGNNTVRWITDPTYKNIVVLTNNKLITGGTYADLRNNSVPTSNYTNSEPYKQTAAAATSPSNPDNPGGSTPSGAPDDEADSGYEVGETATGYKECANILKAFCPDGDKDIIDLVKLVITIMTAGVIVAGTIGIIFCGYQVLTARENTEQLTKAKRRLWEIVIGLVLWVTASFLITLFLPKADTTVLQSVIRDILSY